MNEEEYFDYLVSIGAMRPEEAKLARQQAQVDTLRENAMATPQGKMVGNTYVNPSITQYASQLLNAYGARKGQQDLDTKYGDFNARQKAMLEALRKKQNPVGIPMPMEDEEEKRRREAAMPWATFGG